MLVAIFSTAQFTLFIVIHSFKSDHEGPYTAATNTPVTGWRLQWSASAYMQLDLIRLQYVCNATA